MTKIERQRANMRAYVLWLNSLSDADPIKAREANGSVVVTCLGDSYFVNGQQVTTSLDELKRYLTSRR